MGLLGPNEKARVEKRDGQVLGPYEAVFAGDSIIIADRMADVESGDTILRCLPNGKEERSVVTEATFFSHGIGQFGPHYQVKFRKADETSGGRSSQHINISGAQSVQIGDYNTQNIVGSFEALTKLIDASSASDSEKEGAKSLLSQFLRHPLVVSIVGAVAGAVVRTNA